MNNPYKKQIGGSHYKDMKIQPAQFINENNLPFAHCIDMIIDRDYDSPTKPLPHGFTLTKEQK